MHDRSVRGDCLPKPISYKKYFSNEISGHSDRSPYQIARDYARANVPAHARPYMVALADGDAQFAAPEPAPRCGFHDYVPALHACGQPSIASVGMMSGKRRACQRHAAASWFIGLLVQWDDGRYKP